ncbi:SH3 domain-containing protein [Bacillus sp. P14.5]|uniref:SH3 domain-containing protein n=1 Tax=Bacillus sp. P14.5 TaxID=1983400 RepID=UPI000DEACA6D|nr:SH3 domain-containing protein [Bacillus sp. P14.5]
MKRIIASSVLSTAFLFPLVANADEVSTKDNVEVRKGATAQYPVVKHLDKGTELIVIDEFTNAKGEKWYRIDLGEVKGWIPSFSTESESLTGSNSTINTDNVNIRKGASTSYPIVDKLGNGRTVEIIDSFENSLNEVWYRIEFDGKKGWVFSELVSKEPIVEAPEKTQKVVMQASSVKKGATAAYDEVATVEVGDTAVIIDSFTNSQKELWYRIELGTIKGWVSSEAFEEVETPLPPVVKLMKITVDSASIHKGATNSYEVVYTAKKSDELTVIDSFTNAKGELWHRVDLGTVKGWINSSAFTEQSTPDEEKELVLPENMYAKTNGVNVHSGATTSYKIVEKLNANQKIKVLSSFKNSFDETWVRVQVSEKVSGWINVDFLSESTSINKSLYINVDVANLRSQPSLNSLVVTQATKGTQLTAVKEQRESNGETWYNALYNGKLIWVHESVVAASSIKLNTTINIRTQRGIVRSGATYQYPVKRILSYSDRVTLLAEHVNSSNEKWINVQLQDGTKGWVPEYEVKTDYSKVYALQKAVLRKGANGNYSIAEHLELNETLLVLRELNEWLNVETPDGIRGWVNKAQISNISIQSLTKPSISNVGKDTYITWQKPSEFNLAYSTLSNNSIRIFGGLTDLVLPTSYPKGVSSISSQTLSDGKKAMVVTFASGYSYTLRDYNEKLSIKVVPKGLAGKKIIIDAGHGGRDSGAIGVTGLYEKEVNLYTALYLKEELERAGAIVKLTRSNDTFLELHERTDISNNSDYDAFISIHGDSYTRNSAGSTTFYNKSVNFNGPKSYLLGKAVQNNMVSHIGTANRGVKEQLFYVNRENELPSILVELAFLSNPNEEAKLKTENFRRQAALGIRKGLEEYFNY